MAITLQKKEDKDVAGGYPGLDGDGLLLLAEIPTLDLLPHAAANVTLNSHKITSLADPTADGDAANKDYVDDLGETLTVAIAAAQPARVSSAPTGNYGLLLADANTTVEANKSSAIAINVPLNATQAFPVGTVIKVFALGAGPVTITATGGVTLLSRGGLVTISARYGEVTLRQRAADIWALTGDLA